MPFEKDAPAAALSFGDIILVPFPFTDLTSTKKRPAVVISTAAYGNSRPDVVVMAVTSQLRPSTAVGEVWLSEWQQAGLLKPSALKPVIATLEQRLILRKLGTLVPKDVDALKSALRQIVDI